MELLPTPPLPEPTASTVLAARPTLPIFSAGRWCSATATVTAAAGNCRFRSFSNSARTASHNGADQLVSPRVIETFAPSSWQDVDLAERGDAAACLRVLELARAVCRAVSVSVLSAMCEGLVF